MAAIPTHLFRYIDREVVDDNGQIIGRQLWLLSLAIKRRTPKGVWVERTWNKDRFVLLTGGKRYAYPDLDSARQSYRRRKHMQKWRASTTLQMAEFGLSVQDEHFPSASGAPFNLDEGAESLRREAV